LQNDWNIYKEENFTFELLEEVIKLETPYKTTMQLIWLENQYIDQYDSVNAGYNVENTVEEILNGEKVIMSSKIDASYLKNLIKFDGVLPNKKQKTQKSKIDTKIKNPSMIKSIKPKPNPSPKSNVMLNCILIVEKLIIDGYIINFSRSGLYKILKQKNVFIHENNSFYVKNEYIEKEYFVNGKENKNTQGYKYNQILITEAGKQFIIELLELKKVT